jgi:hypothetical protein
LKERFRDDVIDRSLITAVGSADLAKSPLAIKAKPEWTISAQQVYRQIPPVPMLSNPLTIGNFLLWPDPQEDSVEVNLPQVLINKLPDRLIKPMPHSLVIDERAKAKIVNRIDRSALVAVSRMNTMNLDRMLMPAMDLKQARLKVRRAFFAAVIPELQSFRLTIQPDMTTLETLGTALFTVSLYPQASAEVLETHRFEWTDALIANGYGSRLWKFLPVNLQKLQAFLDINPAQLRSPLEVAVNSSAGTATFLVKLSTIGTQIWQQAIETRQIHQIQGITRFVTKFYARTEERLQINEQPFSTNLATLLANCGPEHIERLDPVLALTTSLIVQSHAFVESIAVILQTAQSQVIGTSNFEGSQGGVTTGVVLTDNLSAVEVIWDAKVKYRLPGWQIGAQQGHLSLANPIDILKPGSSEWIREYTIYTVMMASPTQVATNPDEFEDLEVTVTFSYSASYLTFPLATTFQPKHLDVTEVPFPLMPGQEPSLVGLTVVTKSKSQNIVLASTQRTLPLDALLLNLKIFRDGRIEIQTSVDRIVESSIDDELFTLLRALKEG